MIMYSVLFLCTGNYFRSRFAEYWFNRCIALRSLQDQCFSASAGLNVFAGNGNVGPMADEAIAALRVRGLELELPTLPLPRQVTEDLLESADLIVAVDAHAHRPMVRDKFPKWESKIQFWEIKDLAEGGLANDPICLLEVAVEDLVERLGSYQFTANAEDRSAST